MAGMPAQTDPHRCSIATSDQRVRIDETEAYVYPDLVMSCGTPRYEGPRPLSLLDPTLIAEIASRSTRGDDEGWRWDHYRRIPSLQAYVRVDPWARSVTVYARQADGAWRITDHTGESTAAIGGLGLDLPLPDLFAGLDRLPEDPVADEKIPPA